MTFPDRPGVSTDIQLQPAGPAIPGGRNLAIAGIGRNFKTTRNEEVIRGTRVSLETLTVTTDLYGQTATITNIPILSGSESVFVNTSTLLVRDTHYTINNTTGVITFITTIEDDDVVTVSYSYGSADTLSVVDAYIAAGGSGTLSGRIVLIGNRPDSADYVEDTDFSYAVSSAGVITITWLGSSNQAAGNSIYYITYRTFKYGTDYDPKRFYRLSDVINEYGPILEESGDAYAVTNTLTLGALIALEKNNVTSLYCVQLEGTDNDTNRNEAIDKLENFSEINWVVPLFTSSSVLTHTKDHVLDMSTNAENKYRLCCLGMPLNTSIGSADTPGTLVYMARSLDNNRVVLVAPPRGVIDLEDPTNAVEEYIVDGSFVAVAAASIGCDPNNDVATPWTRKRIRGFKRLLEEADSYLGSQLRVLRNAGCLAIERDRENYMVSHGITTDVDSINTREIAVTTALDSAVMAYKNSLDTSVIGGKLTDSMVNTIKGIIRNVAQALINDSIIRAVGTIDVTENEDQPDTVDVVIPTRPIYGTNFIDIVIPVQAQLS